MTDLPKRPNGQGADSRETRPGGKNRETRPAKGRATNAPPAVPEAPATDSGAQPEAEQDTATDKEPGTLEPVEDTDYSDNPVIPENPNQQPAGRGKAQRPDRYSPTVWEQLSEEQRWAEIKRMKREGTYHGSAPQI